MGGGGGGLERGDPSDDDLVAHADMRVRDDDATAERLQVEQATTPWASFLRGAASPVDIALDDGTNVVGEVREVGRTWSLLRRSDSEVLVMLDHVVSATGVGRSAPASSLEPGVGMVFRRWASRWNPVVIHRVDGRGLRGRIGAVLADGVVLLPETEVPQQILIPMSAIVCATTAAQSYSDN